MTEETQALTRYALHFHYGDDDAWMVTADDGEFVRYDAAAAALTALARDLETSRQERDAALAEDTRKLLLMTVERHKTDAAVRAARAEGLEQAATIAAQRFAFVLANELRAKASAAREGQ